jgi:hypothetical protein
MNREVIICDCHSAEHQVIFNYDKEDDDIYIHIHLSNPSFWSRLKYLFGYKSRFGAWDEIIVSKEEFKQSMDRVLK